MKPLENFGFRGFLRYGLQITTFRLSKFNNFDHDWFTSVRLVRLSDNREHGAVQPKGPNSMTAPATVSGERSWKIATVVMNDGKVQPSIDPQVRRPAEVITLFSARGA